MHTISNAMRFFVFAIGSVIWLGIWLTGFNTVHWVLYLPPILLYFAAITGICPGMMISRQLFPDSKKAAPKKQRKKR